MKHLMEGLGYRFRLQSVGKREFQDNPNLNKVNSNPNIAERETDQSTDSTGWSSV